MCHHKISEMCGFMMCKLVPKWLLAFRRQVIYHHNIMYFQLESISLQLNTYGSLQGSRPLFMFPINTIYIFGGIN